MITVKGLFDGEQIEFLEPVPIARRSLVAIVFLDAEEEDVDEAKEALLLSQSPAFRRLMDRAADDIEYGRTHPAEDFLNEL
jgi:hypothetical protein